MLLASGPGAVLWTDDLIQAELAKLGFRVKRSLRCHVPLRLLAILCLEENAYGVTIRQEIVVASFRQVRSSEMLRPQNGLLTNPRPRSARSGTEIRPPVGHFRNFACQWVNGTS